MPLSDRAARLGGGEAAVWAEARRLYEETPTPAREIAALLGRSIGGPLGGAFGGPLGRPEMRALYRIASRRGWKRHGWPRPETRRAAGKDEGKAAAEGGRRALVRKLERTVAREIAAIDARLRKHAAGGQKDAQGIDHERHAKALATLARTLRELDAIDRAQADDVNALEREGRRAGADAGEDDDDGFPRDADALRDTLARRLGQLSRRRKAG